MKKSLVLLTLLSLLAVLLLSACSTGTQASNSTPTVHLKENSFAPDTIAIKKGQTLTLIDDTSVVHIIQNGSWDSNGNQRPTTEAGAPQVDQQFNGNDTHTIGPFNTAGTFHFY